MDATPWRPRPIATRATSAASRPAATAFSAGQCSTRKPRRDARSSVRSSAPGNEARAGYATQTFTLNQSNGLADGVNYGSVQVQAYNGVGANPSSLSAGQVVFTVTVNSAAYGSLGLVGLVVVVPPLVRRLVRRPR